MSVYMFLLLHRLTGESSCPTCKAGKRLPPLRAEGTIHSWCQPHLCPASLFAPSSPAMPNSLSVLKCTLFMCWLTTGKKLFQITL